ncbi:MAG: heme exporter protein CcmB [Cytophagales bacterium]|nr:heme exporter protein CcmB [Cytophagales bacterium]
MSLVREIQILFKKEWMLESKRKYAINGILLYLAGAVFICYMSFNVRKGSITPITWNALFWIILLFNAVNAIAKSFLQENKGRYFYMATVVSPQAIILSKILYNSLLMTALSGLNFLFYSLVMGNPVADISLFLLNLLLGSIGFSGAFTLVSAIASQANNSGTLMAILGFPIILPLLLLLIKVSKNAMDGLDVSVSLDELATVLAIDAIVVTVSWLLFPFVWKN